VVRFLDDARRRRREAPIPGYREGELHLFLGREYALEICPAARGQEKITLTESVIRIQSVDIDPGVVRERLKAWYRLHADRLFGERMAKLSGRASWVDGVPSMRLRWMKRTWGSCSARGMITLNPQLMKSPPECIDYVIAHEICHLREHNHGSGFYALQEALCPGWRNPRRHLRENAHRYLRF
jgi:predicted metal-dependent hydrolase